jgi:exonuclease SbcD
MARILIIPDLHLGANLSVGKTAKVGELNSRTQDKIKLLLWIVDMVVLHKVDRVVFTGDIFEDPKPDYIFFEILLDFFSHLEELKIPYHIIWGNHDFTRRGDKYFSVLDLIKYFNHNNLAHLHPEFDHLIIDGWNLVFAPFRDRRSFNVDSNQSALELLRAKFNKHLQDKQNILIGHFTLEGSLYVGNEIDDYHNELICPLDYFDKFDWVFMGHIHKPQFLKPNIMHVGSVDVSDFGEVDHVKNLMLFDSESNSITPIIIPTRHFFHFKITIPKDKDALVYLEEWFLAKDKQSSLKDAIVKVELFLDEHVINRKDVEKILYNLGVFNIPSFVEHKNTMLVSFEKKNLMVGVSDPKTALKVYAENNTRLNDHKFKKVFIEYSNQILEKYATNQTNN